MAQDLKINPSMLRERAGKGKWKEKLAEIQRKANEKAELKIIETDAARIAKAKRGWLELAHLARVQVVKALKSKKTKLTPLEALRGMREIAALEARALGMDHRDPLRGDADEAPLVGEINNTQININGQPSVSLPAMTDAQLIELATGKAMVARVVDAKEGPKQAGSRQGTSKKASGKK